MSDVLETFLSEDGQWKVEVLADYHCQSPRECDLGIFLTWHRHYSSPDENNWASPQDFEDWWNGEDVDEDVQGGDYVAPKDDPRYVRLPVFMYDHSGITYRAGSVGGGNPFGNGMYAQFDSGQVGWIFSTPETIETTGAPIDSIAEQLRNEVDYYSKWAKGQCYGYVVSKREKQCTCGECEDWEQVDSCWGFIGHIELWGMSLPDDLAETLKNDYYFKESA